MDNKLKLQFNSLCIPMPEPKLFKMTKQQLYVVTEIEIENQSDYNIEFVKSGVSNE
jgi:hypothetical protein